jgi:hypothetical protein
MADSFIARVRAALRQVQWNIGIVHEPISALLEPNARPVINWLQPPKPAMYLADPFAIIRNGRRCIFCEQFDYRHQKGRIVRIEIRGEHISEIMPVIELPTNHISYPYLLEDKGEIYCVPETAQLNEISLYKAEEYPHKWKRASTLVSSFAGLDSTVFRYQGRWWLTSAEAAHDNRWYRLYIWYAKELLGPWTPHAANPVKQDIGSSRPAGTPFIHNGHLYRPAQDCSRTYGGRIVLNKILRLTPNEFEEEAAAFIEPGPNGPYPEGLHTLSASGDITLVDGKRVRFIEAAFRRTLALNVRKSLQYVRARL